MVTRIALIGNPNSGKTTMFNKLTGSSQRVGNWPGVTVERKEGSLRFKEDTVIADLPGIYSLSAYSPEEIVSRDFLLNDRPDAVINIVDAANLERNLYLTTQILEVGIPTVIALNMMDTVAKEGIKIDVDKLSKALGCRIVETTASKGDGVEDLAKAALSVIGTKTENKLRYTKDLEEYVSKAEEVISGKVPEEVKRWYALKLLERDERAGMDIDPDVRERIEAIVSSMEERMDNDADGIVAEKRYALIGKIVGEAVDKGHPKKKETSSDRIDRIVTGRRFGLLIFAAVMFAIYFIAIRAVGGWASDHFNDIIWNTVIPAAEGWLTGAGVADWLVGLIVHGIIGGVGAVIGFLPQMLVLFIVLAVLGECGYMARVAFVMDRLFRRFGLSGKSFIPVLVGMGCGIPGIMASRAIEGESERRITAMTVTFIPCSAKLPVIALIAGALFGQSALIAVSMYFLGMLCILMSGVLLKKWRSFSGTPSPFIMELPPYHVPSALSVIRESLGRVWAFFRNAGTLVLLACVLVWFLSSFDWGLRMVNAGDSILADIGNALKWIFVPQGFGNDWEFTMATLAGLLTKENIVGTLGVLFGSDAAGGGETWNIIGNMLTQASGYSFLVFNMMCAPCLAAVGAIRKELGSWKDAGKAVLYQCSLAYVLSLVIYQFATIFFGNGPEWWIIPAVAALAGLIYALISKEPFGFLRRRGSNA
ncbi:MAG: ferrous iron transport protein B [Candidatus Methanoplasma sp.]|jgi:ferrous iron transport protein B|nr:ferrous iron transport protein B [Candidatus Methanoplasma sp.]